MRRDEDEQPRVRQQLSRLCGRVRRRLSVRRGTQLVSVRPQYPLATPARVRATEVEGRTLSTMRVRSSGWGKYDSTRLISTTSKDPRGRLTRSPRQLELAPPSSARNAEPSSPACRRRESCVMERETQVNRPRNQHARGRSVTWSSRKSERYTDGSIGHRSSAHTCGQPPPQRLTPLPGRFVTSRAF